MAEKASGPETGGGNRRQEPLAGQSAEQESSVRSAQGTKDGDLGRMSEQRLRQTIQQIISETINMPSPSLERFARSGSPPIRRDASADNIVQRNGSGDSHGPSLPFNLEHYFQPKSYQDLLATAVLNKVGAANARVAHYNLCPAPVVLHFIPFPDDCFRCARTLPLVR